MSTSHTEERRRAEQHRPRTADEIAAAARDLAARGYSDRDIAAMLSLDLAAVRRMIGDRSVAR